MFRNGVAGAGAGTGGYATVHGHGRVWRPAGTDFGAERLRGVQDSDTEDETHEEAADVGEIVEAREKADYEADGDVKEEKEEFFHRGRTL